MKQTLVHIVLFLGLVGNLQGQMLLDTIAFPEVILEESRLQTHIVGTHVDILAPELIDESNTQNLADYLTKQSSFYIKQYGALSTPTFRGTSSAHTLVLWNGMPLNSIANGLLDFAIVPISNFNEVSLVHGGDGSVFGSGAIGGSIHFNSIPNFKQKRNLKLSAERGSFGLKSNSFSVQDNRENIAFRFCILSLSDKNLFFYINTAQAGHPLAVNTYGKLTTEQQQLDLAYRIGRNKLAFAFWASQNQREVPQNMTIPFSDAMQYDDSKRLLLNYKHKSRAVSLELKQAYLQEDFRYTELLKNIDSKYLAESYISDIDFKYFASKFLVNIGSSLISKQADNNNYSKSGKAEQEFSLFTALQYRSNFINLNTVLRKEWQHNFETLANSSFLTSLTPHLALGIPLHPQFNLRLKYNKNFRLPTLNERYWVGASINGNPNLVPEASWNKELGLDFKAKHMSLNATVYSIAISDMIVWEKLATAATIANNLKQVWSRGLELKLAFQHNNLKLVSNYAYTKSTHELAISSLDETLGKQLRYTPLHKGSITCIITEEDLQFILTQAYIGEVISSYDVVQDHTLKAFMLTDIALKHQLNKLPFTLMIKVKNLMDKSYQTYQNYPNPGRELLLTLNYILN